MYTFLRSRQLFWLALLLGMVYTLSVAVAQEEVEPPADGETAAEEPPPDPNAWKKQREEILGEIKKEAEKRAKEKVTKQDLVNKINKAAKKFEEEVRVEENRYRNKFIKSEQNKWREMEDMPSDYPNMSKYMSIPIPEWKVNTDVQKDMLKIKDEMEKDLAKIFESVCKEKDYDQLEEEGKVKYPMYKLLEGKKKPYITGIVLRGGRGYGARQIEGRLEAVTVNRLKIGHRMISRGDLDEETQALFYDDVNQKMVEKYIMQEQRRYKAIKEGFIAEWVSMTYPDMLMNEGYVPNMYLADKNQRHSTGTQNWVQRNVYLERLYQNKLKKEIEKITPDITREFFENAAEKFGGDYNYEFVKEAGDPPGTGEWMPTNVAEEFRLAKEQEAAAKQNGDMPPDVPPPM